MAVKDLADSCQSTTQIEVWRRVADLVGLLGCSASHLRLLEQLHRVAPTKAEVLLIGETGVGKELYARFLHQCSQRSGKFIALNCGAVPDHLFENELFGHSVGAYTDAKSRSDGLVRAAEGGTLFLDEVHRLSITSQVKLLRLLQEREYRRLGETKLSRADFRLVSAMNSDPQAEIEAGRLREDLYYRLNVIPKRIAPLRDRVDDVDVLLDAFSTRYSNDYRRQYPLRFHLTARLELRTYHWPGNIRQLKHMVHSLACQYPDELAELRCTDLDLTPPCSCTTPVQAGQRPELGELMELPFNEAKRIAVRQFECEYILRLLKQTRGNITKSAKLAGKNRRAFFELLRKHGICVDEFK